ncbi:DUF6069 family protein [Amycolatopsis tolypomycina]|uniref:PEP-CTERM protein-sorting domain-containing protein n=1 Tax=Amycolatopsis tolypomycina TaxID=208445 RepID=A0A1H4XCM3_9PSEU|nr:DUF6069 family protein [Amycolatopsis tolypomycina]SED03502.1 hypothetical protein SAMN04489727_6104 [Amycolatopsis tolypomycina]
MSPTPKTAIRLGFALLAAAVANTVIALAATALDDGGIHMGLSPAIYLPFTAVGLLLGAVGWFVLARTAPKALRVVVPAVLVLTWIPDLLLLTAGATVANVVGLMLMHLVVATAIVTALRPTLEPAETGARLAHHENGV